MPYRSLHIAPRLRAVRDGARATQAVLLAVATVLAAAACSPYPSPPDTARDPVVDTLHGVAIADDYRWLEDQDSPETRAWIAEQNAYAERIVGDTPLRRGLETRLRELMNVPGALFPRRAGDYEYFAFRAPDREVGAIYRRPAPEEPQRDPVEPDGDFEVVIDPLDIHPDGTTSVSIRDFSPDGNLMMYAIRDGGQDEVMIRIRDVTTGEDLPDRLPNFLYGSTFFDPDGTGFYYTWRSREVGPRVRHHVLGTDVADDTELFGEGHGPETFINATQGGDGRYMVYTVQHGWARSDVYLHDLEAGTEARPISVGAPARFRARFMDDEIQLLTNLDAPRNRVVAVDLARPRPRSGQLARCDRRGRRPADRLPDHRRRDLRGLPAQREQQDRALRHGRDADGGNPAFPNTMWRRCARGVKARGCSPFTSLVTPTHIVRNRPGDARDRAVAARRPCPSMARSYEVSQVWYTSADGTEAPMFVAHRRGYEPDGDTPTLLYGYGGFNSNNMPRFNNGAAAWMERGGVYALATLRGGGEFGEEWHRAGMLENKPNVFDDFIAAAEWLIANGYTKPDRLAIRGVSNGGLLVGSALTKRPDLYRAVFCGLPDLDMVRFYQFTDSNNMPALLEYGNAAVADEFEVLRTFSPYQNVRDGVAYPAVMLTQGDLDTRVPPLQARKMAAAAAGGEQFGAAGDPGLRSAGRARGWTDVQPRRAELGNGAGVPAGAAGG